MGNDFFRFKQFEVWQQKAAMKVCTDACLFGAMLPTIARTQGAAGERIHALDIGTGTGLLSLMYAQREPAAIIDALELDSMAFEQATENFQKSPWKERLRAIAGDFKQFKGGQEGNSMAYDLIFSNPPFFKGDLKSVDDKRNLALHSTDLNFGELLTGVGSLLKADGIFAALIPYTRVSEFIKTAAEQNLFPYFHCRVANLPQKPFFRSVLLFCREFKEVREDELFIKDTNQEYSLKFKDLLHPYYLYL
ncbi:tRNA1Val (adenine37-N6)-methyltransferase [Arachidicoccus rhizosphaerae]|uniref:tRNA1(Val) (adenine(37)-N6)-methyltransferase n=1 Tax=Arachidicoccus rhizosphaerae TaxID=551991 RepID=A0A1H3ZHZ1_9BACT|nr:methyltransferase [Arachidicoccus rhizosphaerae]SEA23310.1 tRNA1Val (adenine37-N6)-methyltransferase [Arachidicoccus rhizosphaerae]